MMDPLPKQNITHLIIGKFPLRPGLRQDSAALENIRYKRQKP